MAGRKRAAKRPRKAIPAVLSALLVLAALLVYYYEPELQSAFQKPAAGPVSDTAVESEAEVYFFDVGQGDSVLVRVGDYTMLVDAGTRASGDRIEENLAALGVTELDAVVATHPHADHIGAMAQIVGDYPIETFYMPVLPDSQTPTTATYEQMLDALSEREVHVVRITEKTEIPAPENAAFQVLSPRAADEFGDVNDYSAVIRFTYGEVSFLLTGDAETPVEEILLDSGAELSAEVLKCGHHGSSSSTSAAFLRAVNPAVAVISCGADNDYGHPHAETLEALGASGCMVMRTDEDGTVAVVTDGEAYAVHTWSAAEGFSPAA